MDQGLVGCTTCSICDFLKLVEALFYFLVALSFVTAIFFVVLAGFLRIVSIGDRILHTVSKRGLRFTIIGFVVCLVAWFSINAIYGIFGAKNDNWWSLNCETGSVNENQPKEEKYSDLPELEPLKNLNELMTTNRKVGVIDLEKVDKDNLVQDLFLMYPGENLKFLAGKSSFSQDDLEGIANFLNGSSDTNQNLSDMSKKLEELASVEMLDGGLALTGGENYKNVTAPSFDPNEYDFKAYFDKLINLLLKQTLSRVIVYKSGNNEIMLDNCMESGGDWIEFYNECTGRKQVCGKENVKCSRIENKTSGCQCPEGSCLVNGKCAKRSIANNPKKDDDGDGIKNNKDKCSNTPKKESINKDPQSETYGCSCSQLTPGIRSCPATRCEGTNLVTYPPSGTDTCSDGKINQYSCNPLNVAYNATCDQVKNLDNLAGKENEIKKNNDLYNQLKGWLNRGGGSGQGSGSGSGDGGGGKQNQTSGTSGDRANTGSRDTSSTNGTVRDNGATPEGFRPSGDFNSLAECFGFKPGEIPKNGAMIGFCLNPDCTTMDMFYLSPEGKVVGNNGGSSPLRAFPQGQRGGFSQPGIYATQVQYHFSDGSGKASDLTMRGDKLITSSGQIKSKYRYNIHPGTSTEGCLGTGSRESQDNFMKEVWKFGRNYDGGKGRCENNNPNCYNPYRQHNTVLFKVAPFGSNRVAVCSAAGDPYKAIEKLKTQNGYENYDPQLIRKQ